MKAKREMNKEEPSRERGGECVLSAKPQRIVPLNSLRWSLVFALGLWHLLAVSASANGFQEWDVRASGVTNDLLAVSHGNGTFVAVGRQGVILASTNGLDWLTIDSPVELALNGVTHADGRFIAVGEAGTLLHSTNGFQWLVSDAGTAADLFGVAYGGRQFVAVGYSLAGSGVILTSTNGADWIFRDPGIPAPFFAVTHGTGRYLAVGHFSASVSSDGSTWRRVSDPNNAQVHSIAYGNDRFVSAATDVYTPAHPFSVAPDGEYWTLASAGTEGPAFSITFANGLFAAVGGLMRPFPNPTNYIAVSADGLRWTVYPLGLISELRGLTYGARRFLAVGLSGTIIQSGEVTQPGLAIERPNGDTVQLTISGDAGSTYRVQTRSDPARGTWSDWLTVTNTGGTTTVFDSPRENQRLYRLVTP